MEPVDQAIEVLNRIHKTDPTVLPELIFHRVQCNKALADDETVQVGKKEWVVEEEDTYEVGILGIINGLFGVDEKSWGFIYANFDDKGTLVDFSKAPITYCKR